jgi:hypothetical protein
MTRFLLFLQNGDQVSAAFFHELLDLHALDTCRHNFRQLRFDPLRGSDDSVDVRRFERIRQAFITNG